MDAAAKRLRQLEAAGSGPTVILLQSEDRPSPIVAILAQHFRLTCYAIIEPASGDPTALGGELLDAIGDANGPVGLIAETANARTALEVARARPELVNAVALIAPHAPHIALPELKTPVIALLGTRRLDQQIGHKLRAAIANCHLMFIYDTDDDMVDQRPEAVAAALREFLSAGDRFVVTGKSGKLYP